MTSRDIMDQIEYDNQIDKQQRQRERELNWNLLLEIIWIIQHNLRVENDFPKHHRSQECVFWNSCFSHTLWAVSTLSGSSSLIDS